MSHAYHDIAFTPAVRRVQEQQGSRERYAPLDDADDRGGELGRRERVFIQERDGFYQATVTETGWPYVQFKGGPAGFLKVLGPRTIAYADFSGNAQYISTGNLKQDERISIILMDYANRRRLKLLGRARTVEVNDDPVLLEQLKDEAYRARVERAVFIHVEGFDWNCPQHITPRFTDREIDLLTAPLRKQLEQAQEQLSALQARSDRLPEQALGDGPLPLKITGVRQLAPRVRAYQLRAADGGTLPLVTAGAHLALPVRLGDGRLAKRNYSIASDPSQNAVYEVAVLREDEGSGGSKALHEDYRLGLVLHAGRPVNDFALDEGPASAVLIAGGIGITPIKALAHRLTRTGRPFELHFAARSIAEAPYTEELVQNFGHRVRLYASDEGHRMDVTKLISDAAAGSVFYVCGPSRLIDEVRQRAAELGVRPERIRHERFAAPEPEAADQPVTVELRRSGKVIEVPVSTSVLEAVEASGVEAPCSCRVGTCGTCAVKVLEGRPAHRDEALSEAEREQAGLMCICVSRGHTSRLVLDL